MNPNNEQQATDVHTTAFRALPQPSTGNLPLGSSQDDHNHEDGGHLSPVMAMQTLLCYQCDVYSKRKLRMPARKLTKILRPVSLFVVDI
eukprot:6477094-Amphidinium_carterae.2